MADADEFADADDDVVGVSSSGCTLCDKMQSAAPIIEAFLAKTSATAAAQQQSPPKQPPSNVAPSRGPIKKAVLSTDKVQGDSGDEYTEDSDDEAEEDVRVVRFAGKQTLRGGLEQEYRQPSIQDPALNDASAWPSLPQASGWWVSCCFLLVLLFFSSYQSIIIACWIDG